VTANFLVNRFLDYGDKDAIIWQGNAYSYHQLNNAIDAWLQKLSEFGIEPGNVVVLKGDFSLNAVALFLALIQKECIIVPLATAISYDETSFLNIAQCEYSISIDNNDKVVMSKLPHQATYEYYDKLRCSMHPGLVLFSSGTTGHSKAVLHDLQLILEKFKHSRKGYRSISFLLFDHIGGINTMLYLLSNGGCLVTITDRSPDATLKSIERFQVELLPTSPTFINLILLSEAYKRYNLSSLKMVTYGTEPMPETTLKRFHQILPYVELKQTYGLSEIGIMQTKSKSSNSLWLKVGGEGFETKVVDGVLHVKARSAMLGYLNHPDPFTEDGWLNTQDKVEQNGQYFKILGRESDIINVGGEKVYPTTVESVLQSLDNVAEAVAYGIPNSITGQIVCADIRLKKHEDKREFVGRLKTFCRKQLAPFMIPVKVNLVSDYIHSARFKKISRQNV
jgi:acyl-coenzyme A synthetase/AMP-(fatty) acid ligase